MKYLMDYLDPLVSKLLKEHGAFFAFSNSSFEEQKDKKIPKEEYCNMKGYPGLVVVRSSVSELAKKLEEALTTAAQKDLAENGRECIIRRELNNREALYTGSIVDTVAALHVYGITEEEVISMYNKMKGEDDD